MQSLTTLQARMVDEQRAGGRTDRQIEKVMGLTHGFLSRPWVLDRTDDIDIATNLARAEERRRKENAFWRCISHTGPVTRGWRPDGNCVSARPNDKPLRSVPRPPVNRGAA